MIQVKKKMQLGMNFSSRPLPESDWALFSMPTKL